MSEPINDGGPAFPQPNHIVETSDGRVEARGWLQDSGMTLRDWLAGRAMQAIVGSMLAENTRTKYDINKPHHLNCVAEDAYSIADAMLKARGGVS